MSSESDAYAAKRRSRHGKQVPQCVAFPRFWNVRLQETALGIRCTYPNDCIFRKISAFVCHTNGAWILMERSAISENSDCSKATVRGCVVRLARAFAKSSLRAKLRLVTPFS